MRRVWGSPLIAHAVVLGAALFVLLLVTGPRVAFFSDEGAAIIQARQLQRTGSWVEPNPLPTIDPLGQARTIPNGDAGTLGRAPYARHPLYPRLLQLVEAVSGTGGLMVLGIAGTIAAAVMAGMLAETLAPGLGAASLWVVGLGSPLLFDSYLLLAHTLAAACAGLAMWAALRVRRASRLLSGWPLAVFGSIALLSSLRTEGGLFGVALGIALAVVACWPGLQRRRGPAVVSAALAFAAVGLVRTVESRLLVGHVGRAVAIAVAPGAATAAAPLSAPLRVVHGLGQTILSPGYQTHALAPIAAVLAAVLVLLAGLASGRARRPDLAVALLACALALVVGRVVFGSPGPIPGLLVAFPLCLFAAAVFRPAVVDAADARLVLGTLALFFAAVIATQYAIGGGIEWGGRYFALAMPLAGVVIVLTLTHHFRGAGQAFAGAVIALLASITMTLGFSGLLAMRATHRTTARLSSTMTRAREKVGLVAAGFPGGRAIVLTPEVFVPQIEWRVYREFSWLAPDSSQLGDFAHRLRAAGVSAVIVVTQDPSTTLLAIGRDYRTVTRMPVSGGHGLEVLVARV